MFELMKAIETAKNEPNRFLRFIYLKYVRYTLKHTFFKKFDVNTIKIDKNFLSMFKQFRDCHISRDEVYGTSHDPFVNEMHNVNSNTFIVVYHMGYLIVLYPAMDEYEIQIVYYNDTSKCNDICRFSTPNPPLFLKEIIITAIYNYCVEYVYGSKSDLFKTDLSYEDKLKELF